jgi:hypothetical protein
MFDFGASHKQVQKSLKRFSRLEGEKPWSHKQ